MNVYGIRVLDQWHILALKPSSLWDWCTVFAFCVRVQLESQFRKQPYDDILGTLHMHYIFIHMCGYIEY